MVNNRCSAWLLVLAPLLVACTREVEVDIAKTGDEISISVARPGSDKLPCIQGMTITLADTDIATTPSLWEVATAEPGRCRTSFVYGQVPAGYSQSGVAPRLLVGSRYLVEITGPGFEGGQEFTLRAENGKMRDTSVH